MEPTLEALGLVAAQKAVLNDRFPELGRNVDLLVRDCSAICPTQDKAMALLYRLTTRLRSDELAFFHSRSALDFTELLSLVLRLTVLPCTTAQPPVAPPVESIAMVIIGQYLYNVWQGLDRARDSLREAVNGYGVWSAATMTRNARTFSGLTPMETALNYACAIPQLFPAPPRPLLPAKANSSHVKPSAKASRASAKRQDAQVQPSMVDSLHAEYRNFPRLPVSMTELHAQASADSGIPWRSWDVVHWKLLTEVIARLRTWLEAPSAGTIAVGHMGLTMLVALVLHAEPSDQAQYDRHRKVGAEDVVRAAKVIVPLLPSQPCDRPPPLRDPPFLTDPTKWWKEAKPHDRAAYKASCDDARLVHSDPGTGLSRGGSGRNAGMASRGARSVRASRGRTDAGQRLLRRCCCATKQRADAFSRGQVAAQARR
jgi:hypothetical protein